MEILKEEDYGEVIESDLDSFYKPALERYRYLLSLSKKFEINLFDWVEYIDSTFFDLLDYENDRGKEVIRILPEGYFGNNDYIINKIIEEDNRLCPNYFIKYMLFLFRLQNNQNVVKGKVKREICRKCVFCAKKDPTCAGSRR